MTSSLPRDLYNSELREECFDIKTRYEEMFSAKGGEDKVPKIQVLNIEL